MKSTQHEYRAYRSDLSIYIAGSNPFRHVEVYYISFPRFSGTSCSYSNLTYEQRGRLNSALEVARNVAKNLNSGDTEQGIIKAYNAQFYK